MSIRVGLTALMTYGWVNWMVLSKTNVGPTLAVSVLPPAPVTLSPTPPNGMPRENPPGNGSGRTSVRANEPRFWALV